MLTDSVPHNHIAIIGTGFGAIATAVRLQQAGFEDFVLIDRAGDVGGVWRDNSYPGAAVDVKSHLYSLSFAPNPDWHNVFAKQSELHEYLRNVTDQFDLRRRLVLNTEVQVLRWDPTQQIWALETSEAPGRLSTSWWRPARSPSPSPRTCPDLSPSRERGSTRPDGTTASIWPENAWQSSEPERPRSSSCPRSSPPSVT
jgi:hypothetical protein